MRIHTSPGAAREARRLGARAFTVGEHIAFADGEYDTWSARLLAIDGSGGIYQFAPGREQARLTVSWQRQHERRRLDLTAANLVGIGLDDVHTVGLTGHAQTRPSSRLPIGIAYGVDAYVDWLRSSATHSYTDTLDEVTRAGR